MGSYYYYGQTMDKESAVQTEVLLTEHA